MASYSNMGPKSLLEFKGEPLLGRQMRSFHDAGIEEFIIVSGYMSEKMEQFIAQQNGNYRIVNIYNPFYAQMNSIGSLWFAREFLEGDVFITNADTYFESSIFAKMLNNNEKYVFGVDESKKNDVDYRVTLSYDEVLNMGKDISDSELSAEYIGTALIRKEGVALFRHLLEMVVKNGN